MMLKKEWFCPLNNVSVDSIVGILSSSFGSDIDSIIRERYEKMMSNCESVPYNSESWKQKDGCENVIAIKAEKNGRRTYYKDALLKVGTEYLKSQFYGGMKKYFNLGLDLPIWFSKSAKPKWKIMIISQDPLRMFHKDKGLFVSTPWGLHSCNYRVTAVAKKVFDLLMTLINEYQAAVYLTDYVKFYFADSAMENNGIQLSKRIATQESLMPKGRTLRSTIEEEIKIVNPDFIVTFGSWIRDSGFWTLPFDGLNFIPRKALNVPSLTLFHPNAHDSVTLDALSANGMWPINKYYKVAFDSLLTSDK